MGLEARGSIFSRFKIGPLKFYLSMVPFLDASVLLLFLQTSFNKSIPDNVGGCLFTELRIFFISSAVIATYLMLKR